MDLEMEEEEDQLDLEVIFLSPFISLWITRINTHKQEISLIMEMDH